MDILGRSITDIQARMVDQTNYRINVVKGVVATVNINRTFGCYIAGETVIYPNIPTFSRDPKLQVGDKVTIEFINGCRETPVILAPEDIRERPDTTLEGEYIFVVYQSGGSFYLNRYTYAGVLNAELGVLTEIIAGAIQKLYVDADQNVYVFNFSWPTLTVYKYDKNGIFLLSNVIVSTEGYSYISPNGYLYTLDTATRNLIRERNLSDLVINTTYTLTAGHRYYYLTFDSDGYAYLYDIDHPFAYVKWNIDTGELASHNQLNNASSYDGWCVAGDYIGCSYTNPYTISKALGSDRVFWVLDDISTIYRMASIPDYFICLGIDAGAKLIMEKYTSGRVREWKTEVATVFTANLQYCAVAAYPF